jgi:hypothetical protein
MEKNKLIINDSTDLISEYKKTKEHIWMDTNDEEIKIVVF